MSLRPETGIETVQTDRGLVVAQLEPGGAGEQAGLRGFRVIREQIQRGPYLYERTRIDQSVADEILAVDGTRVESRDEFLTLIESKRPGDRVTLTIRRGNREREVDVELAAPSQ